jgi:hypothetical protein
MPIQYAMDIDNHIVRTTFSGTVTYHEAADYATRLRGDLAFDPQFSELVTFGENPDIQLNYRDWQSLAKRDPFSSGSKRAFVVQSRSVLYSVLYGVIRMYEIVRNDTANIRIFETADEAMSWLSAPARLVGAEGR